MSEEKKKSANPPRPPAAIEADLVATRERLVGTIAELEQRVKPANVADRGKRKVQQFYTDEDGVRWDRVAMTAGAVVGSLVALRMVSKTVRWAFAVPSTKQVPAEVVYLPVPRSQVAAVSSALSSA